MLTYTQKNLSRIVKWNSPKNMGDNHGPAIEILTYGIQFDIILKKVKEGGLQHG